MIQFGIYRANHVHHDVLGQLKNFTNDPSRGDVRDNGSFAGSSFKRMIEDRIIYDISFPQDSWIIIARGESSTILGWCYVTRMETNSRRSGHKIGTIGLYVDPKHRRKGIASSLIQEALEVAKNNRMHTIVGNPWNNSGTQCFTRAGFTDPPVPGGRVCKKIQSSSCL